MTCVPAEGCTVMCILKTSAVARHVMYELELGDCSGIDQVNTKNMIWCVIAFHRVQRKCARVLRQADTASVI